MNTVHPAFPDGHFYSPVVNVDDARAREDQIWPDTPVALGIDFKPRRQRRFLTRDFPRYIGDYDYSEDQPPTGEPYQFYTRNSQFSWLDARALFVMLRKLAPGTMIEVGSGFSSLLTADVNRRFLGGGVDFTCIEPYPRPFLAQGVPGISRLIRQRVEDVPLMEFTRLRGGDILFIDSSHVAKTGSDVNYIVFEILPRLRSGVVLHFHDIFLPADYPKDWVVGEGRSWNEQYLLRALLMFTRAFEFLFSSYFAYRAFPRELKAVLDGHLYGGGSIWLRRGTGTLSSRHLLSFAAGFLSGLVARKTIR